MREYVLGAYWGICQEGPQECAARVFPVLRAVGALDPTQASWQPVPRRLGGRPEQSVENISDLAAAFEAGKLLDDHGTWMREGGYMVALRTSGPRSVLITSACGEHGGAFPNSVRIEFSQAWLSSLGTGAVPKLTSLFKQVIDASRPRFAVIAGRGSFSAQHPFIGWMTYLPIAPDSMPDLLLPARWEAHADGVVVWLGNMLPLATDRSFAELGKRIESLLRQAGCWQDINYVA